MLRLNGGQSRIVVTATAQATVYKAAKMIASAHKLIPPQLAYRDSFQDGARQWVPLLVVRRKADDAARVEVDDHRERMA